MRPLSPRGHHDAAATPASPERWGLGLAAGGTAGHVTVALAIAEAFVAAAPEVDVLFLGGRHGVESHLVTDRGFRFAAIPAAPFERQRVGAKISALWQTARSVGAARRLLAAHRARLVLGTGGYASIGALVAARTLGIKTALHEANATPGLANRVVGRVVDRVYLSHRSAATSFPAGRCLVTGTPLRSEILEAARRGKEPRAPERPARVLVTAGSEGSRFLDREAPSLLQQIARLGVPIECRHQVGMGDLDAVRARYVSSGDASATVERFIDDMAAAYAWADLAIAGCGAGTVAELAAIGLPALLVPVGEVAREHQRANAQLYSASGAPWAVRDDEWRTSTLAAHAADLLRRPEAWIDASRAMRRLGTPDAADALVEDCLQSTPRAATSFSGGARPGGAGRGHARADP